MNEPVWTRAYAAAFGTLAVVAIVRKFFIDDDGFITYLSKFTTQSNAIAAVVLLVGALLAARVAGSAGWDRIRGAAVMYMATTGIVYGFLLDGFDNPFTTEKHWTHTVLHQVMPIVMVLDLAIRPLVHRLTWRDALTWTVYPILYLAYSLVRGAIVDWYPYDFINPGEVGGYDGVAMYSLGITAGFLGIASLIVSANHWSHRLPVPAEMSSGTATPGP